MVSCCLCKVFGESKMIFRLIDIVICIICVSGPIGMLPTVIL